MTKKEKELVIKFMLQMACAVGTHTGDLYDDGDPNGLYADCVRHDKLEIATYNKLAKIVGIKEMT